MNQQRARQRKYSVEVPLIYSQKQIIDKSQKVISQIQYDDNLSKAVYPEASQQDIDQSEEQSDNEREEQINIAIRQTKFEENVNKKVVVGTGYSMDVTQFFQFGKKQKFKQTIEEKSWIQQISGGRLAWIILLYSVTTGAMIPGWLMNIPANKLLRQCWRFLMQMIMVIPFMFYEYRTCSQEIREKYKFSYIFKPSNIIKPFVSSLSICLWMSVVLNGMEWTSVTHCIVLGSLPNFFLSLDRSRLNRSHDLQLGGEVLVFMAIILVIIDTWIFNPNQITSRQFSVINTFYFSRNLFERLLFDFSALTMSFITSRFSQYTSDLKSYYPPFLSMFIVNTFNCIHLAFSSFFINGCSFDLHPFFGVWSLFTDKYFAGFMYMAIVLSLGQLISLVLVTRMFPDPIIPALAMTLEPFIATFIIDVTGVQRLPGTYTVIAYVFFVPGLCLILVGQHLYQKIAAQKQVQDQKTINLLEQLKIIKQRRKKREYLKQLRSHKTHQHQIYQSQLLLKRGSH